MNVVINGIEYVPKCDVPEPTGSQVEACIISLVSAIYFNESHKHKPRLWEALNELSPNMAKLANDDPSAAFDRMHPDKD